MIKKAEMLPGTKLKIRPIIKDGIPAGLTPFPNDRDGTLPHMRMTQSAGSFLEGHLPIYSGEIVEVVSGPKRRGECGNTIIVRNNAGVEGHVYWCEMRASADIV